MLLVARRMWRDRGAMAEALAEIEAKLGPVHGVIHAAGLTSNERVMVQSAVSAERVLRPKVQGSEVPTEILTGKPLDFLAFCSSISAIHPAPGGAWRRRRRMRFRTGLRSGAGSIWGCRQSRSTWIPGAMWGWRRSCMRRMSLPR